MKKKYKLIYILLVIPFFSFFSCEFDPNISNSKGFPRLIYGGEAVFGENGDNVLLRTIVLNFLEGYIKNMQDDFDAEIVGNRITFPEAVIMTETQWVEMQEELKRINSMILFLFLKVDVSITDSGIVIAKVQSIF